MKKERKEYLIGITIYAIIYAVVIFLAIKGENPILTLIIFMLTAFCILLIANMLKNQHKKNKKKVKYDINYPYYVILTVLVTLFTSCIFLLADNMWYKVNGEKTTAVITKINKEISYETEYDEDGNRYEKEVNECDVYIEYSVNNQKYKATLDTNNCGYSKGDKVKIYYDKEDPSSFASDSSVILLFSTALTGFALAIYMYMTYKEIFKRK